MPDADWLAVCVRKTPSVTDAIRENVLTKTAVKTEDVQWPKVTITVIAAETIAGKDCCPK